MTAQQASPEIINTSTLPDLKGIDQLLTEKRLIDADIKQGADPVVMSRRLDVWIHQTKQLLEVCA